MLAQQHREYYKDKTGTLYPVPTFQLPKASLQRIKERYQSSAKNNRYHNLQIQIKFMNRSYFVFENEPSRHWFTRTRTVRVRTSLQIIWPHPITQRMFTLL
ncbi:hypothetical protein EG68_12029 [Paragonimus skrjabini miyazakii]|uniref:Uncharacterized protein n=1 Tax=Paragonimus skrjabini miyazakii TaxID=59628 RepID=A0A8S9YH07_9TREM|nr:hypothetical protein EG68_12029 [Paragonimus skrjabini miyazakii]